MQLLFSEWAWQDYLYWQKQDRRMVERINLLVRETRREPFAEIGKPAPLKHAVAGCSSGRITNDHRLVYRMAAEALVIAQLRYQY